MARRSAIAALLAAALCAACLPVAAAGRNEPDKLPATQVRDLHYGDVLFRYFIGDDFEALTRLEAYSHWELQPHHAGEAELLAGGLYLQLGMHNEAGRRFESLLAQGVPASVKSRAWFYLAKVWYARGYDERAIESLRRIDGLLEPALQAERVHLEANALLNLGRHDEAIALLSGWQSASSWAHYARYNLGVALARSDRLEQGERFLDAVGRLQSTEEELLALKDKANLALGFAWLQAGEPARAAPYLERVRLAGPQSSRALLGLGWALSAQGRNEEALTPWLELRERNLLDAAVQESQLAVPHAFAELGASVQAAGYYEQALQSFDREQQRIDAAIARIRGGGLLANLLGGEDADSPQRGWFWQLSELPDTPESRYLYPVLAGHDFQEGLKNVRDLAYLGSTLARWDENMVVYADMIATRDAAYAGRLPRVDALLAADPLRGLTRRRKVLEGRFNDVVNLDDVAALGTPEQREQWELVAGLEAALAAEPDDPETDARREKLQLVKGALFWYLWQASPQRLYRQRRELRGLDGLLAEADRRWLRLEQAREGALDQTGGFAARVDTLQQRLTALRARLADARAAQGALLARIAIDELSAQRARIDEYEVQARFALATIYDRAAEEAGQRPGGASARPGEGTP